MLPVLRAAHTGWPGRCCEPRGCWGQAPPWWPGSRCRGWASRWSGPGNQSEISIEPFVLGPVQYPSPLWINLKNKGWQQNLRNQCFCWNSADNAVHQINAIGRESRALWSLVSLIKVRPQVSSIKNLPLWWSKISAVKVYTELIWFKMHFRLELKVW